MSFSARVILDSIGPNDARLTTFELVMPRIVLAEFNTHRMFSRNSASSRAIPVEKMLKRVDETPFVPMSWGKNQKGMQAEQELTEDEQRRARLTWYEASKAAIYFATQLKDIGVHKQITNRLLEPFMWHVVIFTATELDNFIALRNDKMAAPEIQKPAALMVEAYEASVPMRLQAGEWHLPFVTTHEVQQAKNDPRFKDGTFCERGVATEEWSTDVDWLYWARISAARCARTSYLTHEGKRDLVDDEQLYTRLVQPGHMSPLEHPAMALTEDQWVTRSRQAFHEWRDRHVPMGNFWGWLQFRKTIEHEHNAKLLRAAGKL